MKYLEVKLTLLCVCIISISLLFTALSSAKIDPKTLAGVWLFDEVSGNGVLDAEDKPPSKYQADHPLWIGRYYDLNRVFNGLIDEVAVFTVALTKDDIKSIVKNGIGKATGIAAVSPAGKLAQTWAKIKAQ